MGREWGTLARTLPPRPQAMTYLRPSGTILVHARFRNTDEGLSREFIVWLFTAKAAGPILGR